MSPVYWLHMKSLVQKKTLSAVIVELAIRPRGIVLAVVILILLMGIMLKELEGTAVMRCSRSKLVQVWYAGHMLRTPSTTLFIATKYTSLLFFFFTTHLHEHIYLPVLRVCGVP